jgi:hypothetical protein
MAQLPSVVSSSAAYWGPEIAEFRSIWSWDLLLDMKEDVFRCTQWSKIDGFEWVARNWKENKDKLKGMEVM